MACLSHSPPACRPACPSGSTQSSDAFQSPNWGAKILSPSPRLTDSSSKLWALVLRHDCSALEKQQTAQWMMPLLMVPDVCRPCIAVLSPGFSALLGPCVHVSISVFQHSPRSSSYPFHPCQLGGCVLRSDLTEGYMVGRDRSQDPESWGPCLKLNLNQKKKCFYLQYQS